MFIDKVSGYIINPAKTSSGEFVKQIKQICWLRWQTWKVIIAVLAPVLILILLFFLSLTKTMRFRNLFLSTLNIHIVGDSSAHLKCYNILHGVSYSVRMSVTNSVNS